MRTTVATLLGILGLYFATSAGTVIVVRSAGHTALFKVLDTVTGYLPVVGPALLLGIGFTTALRGTPPGSRSLLVKLVLILVLAAVPFLVHMGTFALTYTAGAPPLRTMWGPLSVSEWLVMVLGCVLIASGVFLFLRAPNAGLVQAG